MLFSFSRFPSALAGLGLILCLPLVAAENQAPIVTDPKAVPLDAAGPERAVFDYGPVYTGDAGDRAPAAATVVKDWQAPVAPTGWSGNFARNPGFEEDFVNASGEGHVLSFKGDWYYNQRDLKPDYWKFSPKGTDKSIRLLTQSARSGQHALKLAEGQSATQSFSGAMYNSGGSAWSPGGVVKLPITDEEMPRFRQPWRASVWVRGTGTLVLGGATATATGSGQWEQLTVELPADKAPHPHSAMSVTLKGPGEFDDLVVRERFAEAPNLVADPSFEKAKDGRPTGWSAQQKYRSIGPTYYVWTDWNHCFAPNRGPVTVDTLVAHSGRQSMRFDVYPGDEKYVESDLIPLNQQTLRVVEVGVWVRADRIKLIDVRCVDQDGFYMPAVRPRRPEWKGGGSPLFGNGTFGWRYVRKFFGSLDNLPIKGVRVRLAARGLNGHTLDDFGTRPQFTQVGTVWWDDLRVTERASTAAQLKARGVKIPRATAPRTGDLAHGDLDLGERMVGENLLRYAVTNTGGTDRFQLRLTTQLPGGEPVVTESKSVKAKKGGRVELAAPYTIDRLAGHLAHQGSFMVELLRNGKAAHTGAYAFNTWPVVADIDVARAYSLPEENPVTWSVNLGIAQATSARVATLEVQLVNIKSGKVHSRKRFKDLAAAFAETANALPTEPSFAFNFPTPAYWVDRYNLIIDTLDLKKLKVWPHDHPVRDSKLVIRGLDRRGNALFTQDSDAFGRMAQRPPRPAISKVEVREDGALLINGEPKILTGASGHLSNRMPKYPDAVKAQIGLLGTRLSHGKENNHDSIRALWEQHNMYALMIKPVQGMGSTKAVRKMTDEQKSTLAAFAKAGGMKNVATINTGGWEATINVHDKATVADHTAMNDWLRKTTNRLVAISTSGAYNAWWISKMTFYDINHAETESWGPMDYNVIFTPYMKRAGRTAAWLYLPQLYDNHPYERYRFETYENLLRGSVGVSWIQGIGDPTLSRGLAGEMRAIQAPFFSREPAPAVSTLPNGISHRATQHDDKTYIFATNCGPVICGQWSWNKDEKHSGAASHDGNSWNDYWQSPGGVRLHGFRGLPMPELIQKGDKIVQYIRVDPTEKPDWAVLAIRGDGKFIHNAAYGAFDFAKFVAADANMFMFSELNHSVWHEAYIIADDETYERSKRIMGAAQAKKLMKDRYDKHRQIVADRIYQPSHFRKSGALPKAGEWVRLEIDAEAVGLVGRLVDGVAYMTGNGRALWDYTALERGGQVVRVFSDDAAGISRNELPEVRINVEGLKAGTRVKVLFEQREIVAEDGYFVDNFVGTDTYGYESRAPEGDLLPYPDLPAKQKDEDKELPRMLPSGHGYNYGPTAVHIYEIAQ
jgi:hypothetical protein